MCISVQVGVLGPLFRKGCMCIVHAGKDLRLRSALLQGGCGPNQVEPQLAKLSPSLSALKPVRKTPGKDRVCGAAGEVGGKQQGKATKHVPQLSSLPGRRKNGNHMKKKKKTRVGSGGGSGEGGQALGGTRGRRDTELEVEWSLLQSCVGLETMPPSPSTEGQVSFYPQVAVCLLWHCQTAERYLQIFLDVWDVPA